MYTYKVVIRHSSQVEAFSLIMEILVVGLLILAAVAIIRYPKDIIRAFFNFFRPEPSRIRSWIFFPFWIVGRLVEVTTKFEIYDHENEDLSEEPYKSTKNLKFNFGQGTKYIASTIETEKITEIIKSFIGISYANITFDDFIVVRSVPSVIKCPNNIPFYDFNLLVQHSYNKLGTAECSIKRYNQTYQNDCGSGGRRTRRPRLSRPRSSPVFHPQKPRRNVRLFLCQD